MELTLGKKRASGEIKYNKRYRQKERACYVMLSPQIIGFCVFTIVPLLWAVSHAWTYYDTFKKIIVRTGGGKLMGR